MSVFGKPSPSELALEAALNTRDLSAVDEIIAAHPEVVTDISYLNWTWLMHAVSVSSPEIVERFLALPIDVNRLVDDGYSALHCAIERNVVAAGHKIGTPAETERIVRRLAAAGADLNVRGFNDWTPLHRAVAMGDFALVKLLVELGADSSLRTRIDDCSTPLEDALSAGKKEIAEFLQRRR